MSKNHKTKKNNEAIKESEDLSLLLRAAELLKEAQSGFLATIGGGGPYEDRVSGIFFTRIEGRESKVFLFSQWSGLTEKLLKEIDQ
jgi:hypothetical protein